MTLLKYTVYAMTPPSYDVDEDEHCCDCEHCWDWPDFKECPYMVPQFCMLCNDKSTLALSLDRDIQTKLSLGKHAGGSILFWVCDKHVEDKKLLGILQRGVDSKIARNKRRLISYVRGEMERER
jgi:hypothetical protein